MADREISNTQICILRRRTYFPLTLKDVDDIDDASMDRYKEDGCGVSPAVHWTFLFEIVDYENSNLFGRPDVLCKDLDGKLFKMTGYFENSCIPRRDDEFDNYIAPKLKAGHVLALRYAEKKTFLDRTVGIRLEDGHVPFLEVLPGSLSEVLSTADALFENEAKGNCWSCGIQNIKLKSCSRCKAAKYCSKECQMSHWKPIHQVQCRLVDKVLDLVGRGQTPFELSKYDGIAIPFRH